MTLHTVRRDASVFLALLRQEIQMIAQYRWWLLAMQASGIVTPLVSLLVWRGVIVQGGTSPVSQEYLTIYLVLVSLVTMLTSSWTSRFLAESIRLGRLNTWLVRPCSTHLAAAANNVAEKIAKLATLLPLLAALAAAFHEDIHLPTRPGPWLLFAWALLMGATMTFSLDVIVGSLAFWWQDVSAVDRFRQLVTLFLSGALVPLAVMPAAWGPFLAAQPFGYIVAFPIETLLEPNAADLRVGLVVQAAWVVLALATARFVWRRGLRHYHGAGA
ncbi:ABC transporter permease [Allostreptomyces psammosilenae]|uniref:ABC-2 type transport system permease protein n=1 Tax=Allostreptomyces psammosilenae TaxID=1892865 RepID=A0A852ZRH5_9ACTN|nr:ABC-2 family transporter protein [Allostreptomyces psammosilenae]NYI04375.1 ABC-2 type transport system permease protein [Allostreptomyces psammosilenae]